MFKFLASIALAFVSFSAFAQHGTFGYNQATRQWLPPGVVIGNNSQVYSSGGQQVTYGSSPVYALPQGVSTQSAGLNGCQFWGGLAGGTIGSLNKAHTGQATILGAILGGVVADHLLCKNQQGQQVLVVQQPAPVAAPTQGGVTVYGAQSTTRHVCLVGNYIVDVAVSQDCRNLDDAVRSVGGKTYNGPGMPPTIAGNSQSVAQPQGWAPSDGAPDVLNGQTCAAFTKAGVMVMDFLSEDKTVNPLTAPGKTGEECRAAKARYANG
jgi:hypothetical protein